MKNIIIKDTRKKDIVKVAKELKCILRPGDIILSGPIPKNLKTKYFNIISILMRRMFKGITHSCIYMGKDKIMDIDARFMHPRDIEIITIRQFLERKITSFGGVRVYVVVPKNYKRAQRRLAILESKNIAKNIDKARYTYLGSIILGWRFLFRKRKQYAEDLSARNLWTCAEMVAYVMKKSGTDIGKRASYTFVPPMFANRKYFRVEGKIILK